MVSVIEREKQMKKSGLEAGADRKTELGVEGFVGRDYLGNEH
jgi:hypothetical protein